MLAQDTTLVRRVGAVAMIALTLLIGFFVFVYDRIDWGSHIHVRVFFHTSGGMQEGAAFVVGGRDIGRVETIAPVMHGTKSPLGGDEGVALRVAIDSSIELHVGDVFMASRGALSGKYLELGPAEAGAPAIHDGDELLGRDPPTLDRVLQRTWDNLSTLGKFADEIRPELDALRAQVDELRSHFDTTSANTAVLVPQIDRMGPLIADTFEIAADARRLREHMDLPAASAMIDRARAMVRGARGQLAQLSASADRLSAAMATVRARVGAKAPELVDKLDLAIDRVKAAIAKVDPLLAQLDALNAALAQGSLMKLANDPEFPEEAKELGKIMKRQPWKIIDRPPK